MKRTILQLAAAAALALVSSRADAECVVRPVEGTVGFRVAQQSQRTNAQAFGAVQLAEETLFTSKEVDTDGDGKPDRTEPFPRDWGFGMRLNNVFNVTRVPTIYQGDCFDLKDNETRKYGMHAVDLYATAVAYRFRIPQIKRASFFYAGSITGSTMGRPERDGGGSWGEGVLNTRYNTAYAYGFAAIPLALLAPLAPLINKDSPPTQLAGDFLAGLEVDLPAIGAARFGYAYSKGIFTNVSVDRIKLLAEALLTQEFSSLALIKAGFRELSSFGGVGRSTIYGRSLQLAAPRPADEATSFAKKSLTELGFTTAHLEQTDIGDYIDLRFAYAFRPDPFVHEARVGFHGSTRKGEENPLRFFRANIGLVQLPALPFYGVEGGRALSFDVSYRFKSDDGSFEMGVERNSPNLLVVFPYAYDSTSIFIRGSGLGDYKKEKDK